MLRLSKPVGASLYELFGVFGCSPTTGSLFLGVKDANGTIMWCVGYYTRIWIDFSPFTCNFHDLEYCLIAYSRGLICFILMNLGVLMSIE